MAEIKWKSQEEIEEEKNKPKPPTLKEELEATKQTLQATEATLDTILTVILPTLTNK